MFKSAYAGILIILSFLNSCNDMKQEQQAEKEIILEGGAVLTMCVPPRKSSCELTEEERNATWGIFPTYESCHFKEVLWKELGAKGDPQCVPCERITEYYVGEVKFFECVWRK